MIFDCIQYIPYLNIWVQNVYTSFWKKKKKKKKPNMLV